MQASNILHISRVLHLESSNMDEFITHDYLMLENEVATIPDNIENVEKKPLMKLANFHSLAIKMINTSASIIKYH